MQHKPRKRHFVGCSLGKCGIDHRKRAVAHRVRFVLQVQEALDQLQAKQKRTTLTVAHRLTTIRNSDKIAVLNGGGVQELGTHDELLALKGLYFTYVCLGEKCVAYQTLWRVSAVVQH